MTAISIHNISKTYPANFARLREFFGMKVKESVEALRNVSFDLNDGEIFGLIGRNGAGKTTLTKIIATLVQPTSGTVLVDGFDSVSDDVKVRALVGLSTAEERSFYWRLSCERNLMFFGRLYGMTDKFARHRIGELFEQLELTDLAKRRFSNLSTGNKQKLAIARALLASPPILLLDEPTRSLDPLAAEEMRKLIGSLEGVSVLSSTSKPLRLFNVIKLSSSMPFKLIFTLWVCWCDRRKFSGAPTARIEPSDIIATRPQSSSTSDKL